MSILSLVCIHALISGSVPSTPATKAGLLRLDIHSERAQGQVIIAIFDSPRSFKAFDGRKEQKKWPKLRRIVRAEPRTQQTNVEIKDLEVGHYGILVFHDVNNNGKIDTNWVGLPAEPWGLSNNVRPRKFPPKKPDWEDIQFSLAKQPLSLTIDLRPGM